MTNIVAKTVEGIQTVMRAPDGRAGMAVRASYVAEAHGEVAVVRAFEDVFRGGGMCNSPDWVPFQ